MALKRKREPRSRKRPTEQSSEATPDGLCQVIACLADLKTSSLLMFSHSLTMTNSKDAAAIWLYARGVKALANRGLKLAEQLRAGQTNAASS